MSTRAGVPTGAVMGLLLTMFSTGASAQSGVSVPAGAGVRAVGSEARIDPVPAVVRPTLVPEWGLRRATPWPVDDPSREDREDGREAVLASLRGDAARKGAVIGGTIGAVAGLALGIAAANDDWIQASAGDVVAVTLVFGGAGAGIGALVGALQPTDPWWER